MTGDNKHLGSVRGKTKALQEYRQPLPNYDPPSDILRRRLNYVGVDLLQVQMLLRGLISAV
jgi:hypothetical protein